METTRSFLPSPADGKHTDLFKGSDAAEYNTDSGGSLAAFVFKTTADPFVGKLSVFRVYQGTIKSNSEVWNGNREQAERIGQLYLPKGKNQENVTEITAGDIGAIGKLSATLTGDTLCTRDTSVTFPKIKQPVGYFRMAVTVPNFVGKLSVFRVYQGTIKSNSEVWNSNRERAGKNGWFLKTRGCPHRSRCGHRAVLEHVRVGPDTPNVRR